MSIFPTSFLVNEMSLSRSRNYRRAVAYTFFVTNMIACLFSYHRVHFCRRLMYDDFIPTSKNHFSIRDALQRKRRLQLANPTIRTIECTDVFRFFSYRWDINIRFKVHFQLPFRSKYGYDKRIFFPSPRRRSTCDYFFCNLIDDGFFTGSWDKINALSTWRLTSRTSSKFFSDLSFHALNQLYVNVSQWNYKLDAKVLRRLYARGLLPGTFMFSSPDTYAFSLLTDAHPISSGGRHTAMTGSSVELRSFGFFYCSAFKSYVESEANKNWLIARLFLSAQLISTQLQSCKISTLIPLSQLACIYLPFWAPLFPPLVVNRRHFRCLHFAGFV